MAESGSPPRRIAGCAGLSADVIAYDRRHRTIVRFAIFGQWQVCLRASSCEP